MMISRPSTLSSSRKGLCSITITVCIAPFFVCTNTVRAIVLHFSLVFYYRSHFFVSKFMDSPWSRGFFLTSLIHTKRMQQFPKLNGGSFWVSTGNSTHIQTRSIVLTWNTQSACPFDHRGSPLSEITQRWWPYVTGRPSEGNGVWTAACSALFLGSVY